MENKLYTPTEIVKLGLLGIKGRKLREIIKNGEIGFINISKGTKRPTYRISQEAIDEYLQKNTTESTSSN